MVSEEEIKKLVITRLQSMPENLKLSIGSLGSFDRKVQLNQETVYGVCRIASVF